MVKVIPKERLVCTRVSIQKRGHIYDAVPLRNKFG